MAVVIVMPKQGQSVESCIISAWLKQVGEAVQVGDALCEVETDKALLSVESQTAGTMLAHFYKAGDDVPVLTTIAAVGTPGEDVSALRPSTATGGMAPVAVPAGNGHPATATHVAPAPIISPSLPTERFISPRARALAIREQIDIAALIGSGPDGRIIERDVQAAIRASSAPRPRLSPLAQLMVASGEYVAPESGSGPKQRVMTRDLQPTAAAAAATSTPAPAEDGDTITIPFSRTRKVIAARMLESLQTTAQLTLNASADARSLQAYRKRSKESDATAPSPLAALKAVTINDLLLFAVSRTLPTFPDLNAWLTNETITQHRRVHLGFAVDTPRGLLVPVIRNAHLLSLKALSDEARRLATACQAGNVTPDDLSGGTFTVSNLGSFGIESFTPVLNPPQVAILGVGNINLKPVEIDGAVQFIPHLGLSLTVNHQAVDGAPGARFLQRLAQNIAAIELVLAL
jgi:pyruvate dehydrogenase E2 component (dihydrolipoamide acetyltransferase)